MQVLLFEHCAFVVHSGLGVGVGVAGFGVGVAGFGVGVGLVTLPLLTT